MKRGVVDSTEDMSASEMNMENGPANFIVVTHDLDGEGKHYIPGCRPYGNVYVTFNQKIAYAVYQNLDTGGLVLDPLGIKLTGDTSPNPNYRGGGWKFVKEIG